MTSYSAILVDDELSALGLLENKVSDLCPDLDIKATFQSPATALKELKLNPPDILFLDIEMPRMSGFDLLMELSEVNFQVIFVTAYSEYALKALKESAVDYILKPVDDSELLEAVEKARTAIIKQQQAQSGENLLQVLKDTISRTKKIVVPTAKGLSLIPENEVVHLEGYEGYTRIHLISGETITSSYNLGKFAKSLSEIFFKCHKSHIVNIESVRTFENEGYLLLSNDTRVPISKTHRKVFLGLFN